MDLIREPTCHLARLSWSHSFVCALCVTFHLVYGRVTWPAYVDDMVHEPILVHRCPWRVAVVHARYEVMAREWHVPAAQLTSASDITTGVIIRVTIEAAQRRVGDRLKHDALFFGRPTRLRFRALYVSHIEFQFRCACLIGAHDVTDTNRSRENRRRTHLIWRMSLDPPLPPVVLVV